MKHTSTKHSGTEPVPDEEIKDAIRAHIGDSLAMVILDYPEGNSPEFTARTFYGDIADGHWCIDGPDISVITEAE